VLSAGGVAAVVVPTQAGVGVVKDSHRVVPRHLLRPRLAGPPGLGVVNLAAVVSAVRLLEALARVVEAVPATSQLQASMLHSRSHAPSSIHSLRQLYTQLSSHCS